MKNKQRLYIRQKNVFFFIQQYSQVRKTLGKGERLNGSDQREVTGVGKVANEKYMSWTVVIDVFLLLIWPPFEKKHISFPLTK
jgi:hypothetical protein